MKFWRILFGGYAQIVVGAIFIALTIFQWVWWSLIHPPSVTAVFHVSMEALAFSAYAVVAVGVNSLITERMEQAGDFTTDAKPVQANEEDWTENLDKWED